MKTILIPILLSIAISTAAQIPGTRIDGPLKINDQITVKEGDTLKIGVGSNSVGGNFRFIYTPANYLLGIQEESIDRSFTGKSGIIKTFKQWKNKKTGEKTFTVINLGGLNSIVDLEAAIQSGEIVAINGKPIKQATAATATQPATSVADELKKLKELLDQGILTKEEFDAAKKKLLGN